VLDRKIAFVDLSEGSIRTEALPVELRLQYIGGRGLNHRKILSSLGPVSLPAPWVLVPA
jgi:aldehyde:ferredoxin oxidoreductase